MSSTPKLVVNMKMIESSMKKRMESKKDEDDIWEDSQKMQRTQSQPTFIKLPG
jgi:hypothetical protein